MSTRFILNFQGVSKDAYRASFAYSEAVFHESVFRELSEKNDFVHFLDRIAFTDRIPLRMNLPLRRLIQYGEYRGLCKTIGRSDRVCLITNQYFYRYDLGVISGWLRRRYKEFRLVYYFSDLVSANYYRTEMVKHLSEVPADLIVSYDPGDAEKYGFLYIPMPYGGVSKQLKMSQPSADLSFAGKDKGRRQELSEIYRILTERGLNCEFYIQGEGERPSDLPEGIHWYTAEMSYAEYLQKEALGRCILELVQEQSMGHTLRVPEAVFLGRKFLTNNRNLAESRSFDPEHMRIFTEPEEIETAFLKEEIADYPEEIISGFAAEKYFKTIEKALKWHTATDADGKNLTEKCCAGNGR